MIPFSLVPNRWQRGSGLFCLAPVPHLNADYLRTSRTTTDCRTIRLAHVIRSSAVFLKFLILLHILILCSWFSVSSLPLFIIMFIITNPLLLWVFVFPRFIHLVLCWRAIFVYIFPLPSGKSFWFLSFSPGVPTSVINCTWLCAIFAVNKYFCPPLSKFTFVEFDSVPEPYQFLNKAMEIKTWF